MKITGRFKLWREELHNIRRLICEMRLKAEAERDELREELNNLQVKYSQLDNDHVGLLERYKKLYSSWRQVAILLGGVDDEDVVQEVKTVMDRTGAMSQEIEALTNNLETAAVIYGRKMASEMLNPITDEWRKKVEKLQAQVDSLTKNLEAIAGWQPDYQHTPQQMAEYVLKGGSYIDLEEGKSE